MGLLSQTQQQYYDGNDYGGYQFISLNDIINYFMIAYVGEDKIISKVSRTDVAFHAQRALTELSFDTLKSHKAQEITLPSNLQMILPQDYVNYTRVLWVDSSGIKHPLYPTKHTQNPTSPFQNSDGEFKLTAIATLTGGGVNITLDKIYTNITVGMRVYGEKIQHDSHIQRVRYTSTQTEILLTNFGGSSLKPTATGFDGDVEVYFTRSPLAGAVIQERTTSFKVENMTWSVNDNVLTAASTDDISEVKVGMIISTGRTTGNKHAFPIPTVVTDFQGTSVHLSNNSIISSATNTSHNIVVFLGDIDDSETWKNYKSATPSENNNDDYKDDTYWPADGERYGLDPQHAQVNGSFFIDDSRGLIHFSSNLSGKTIVLDYISDSLGTDGEMIVHKFAEEAMYKWIAHAVLSTRANVPEFQIARFKKERFAAVRTAKLRLSNIKLEEITQILRGKSKQIKH